METNLKVTVEQAISQGYTHCFVNEEDLKKISSLDEFDWESETPIVLAEKGDAAYQIREDVIRQLLYDYISEQDEVVDEDCQMAGSVRNEVDFTEITKKVNEVLAKRRFWHPTDTVLTNKI